ncbi:MAG: methyltransferase [Panacagrimonas sp.]
MPLLNTELVADAEAQTAPHGEGPAAGPAVDAQPNRHLVSLGRWLLDQKYQFICPTPETHARVNARTQNQDAISLRDAFGWSRRFRRELLPHRLVRLLLDAAQIEECGGFLRSKVRYSTIGDRLFVHSAFPPQASDAVFLGPDTYRFVAFVRQVLEAPWPYPVHRVLDIGCGSGAGAITATDGVADRRALRSLVLSDINPLALDFAATNVAINDVHNARCTLSDGLSSVTGQFDLIIANPPYMIDSRHRTYCDGGVNWGVDIARRFLEEALPRLSPGGRLVLYTGTPVINGQDLFHLASLPILEAAQKRYRLRYQYSELDPDVFGEDLALPAYAAVDRIAVVGLVAQRSRSLQ